MQISNRDAALLLDMVQVIQKLQESLQDISCEAFLESWMIQKAVERSFEILGEAARRLSEEFRNQHPQIDWSRMIGLRNIIAHQYEDVDYEILWGVITASLPDLLMHVEALLPPLPDEENL